MENKKNLYTALAAYFAETHNIKCGARNSFFKSTYATLDDVLDVTRPILAKHGLFIHQDIFSLKDPEGMRTAVKTTIFHSSGESHTGEVLILPDVGGKGTNPAQKMGIESAYGRRYQLMAALGIIGTDMDQDGNNRDQMNGKAKQSQPAQNKPAPAPVKTPAPVTPELSRFQDELKHAATELNKRFGRQAWGQLSGELFGKLLPISQMDESQLKKAIDAALEQITNG